MLQLSRVIDILSHIVFNPTVYVLFGAVLTYLTLQSNLHKPLQEKQNELSTLRGSTFRRGKGVGFIREYIPKYADKITATIIDIHLNQDRKMMINEKNSYLESKVKYIPFINLHHSAEVVVKINNSKKLPDMVDICIFSNYYPCSPYTRDERIENISPQGDHGGLIRVSEFDSGEYILLIQDEDYWKIKNEVRRFLGDIIGTMVAQGRLKDGKYGIDTINSYISSYDKIVSHFEGRQEYNSEDNFANLKLCPEEHKERFYRRGRALKDMRDDFKELIEETEAWKNKFDSNIEKRDDEMTE